MLSVAPEGEQAGETSLSGNLSRAKEEVKAFSSDSDHVQNLGMMIEAMENTLRSDMDGKTREILIMPAITFVFRLVLRHGGSKVMLYVSYYTRASVTIPESCLVLRDHVCNALAEI